MEPAPKKIKTGRIFDRDMIKLDARIKSYEKVPRLTHTAKEFAEAGFYYDSNSSVCFHCGLQVSEWKPEDNPWFEHALRQKEICEF